jgi:predicted nucleic acid-binding protein
VKSKACLDTGVITLFYSENAPSSINELLIHIEKGTMQAYTLYPLLVEVIFHICKLDGKDAAIKKISNFLNEYPIKIISLDPSLCIKAGLLRCQHRTLSYNDCIAVSFCLNHKMTLHTTEKKLKDLTPNLTLKTYFF